MGGLITLLIAEVVVIGQSKTEAEVVGFDVIRVGAFGADYVEAPNYYS